MKITIFNFEYHIFIIEHWTLHMVGIWIQTITFMFYFQLFFRLYKDMVVQFSYKWRLSLWQIAVHNVIQIFTFKQK